jgi:hypothetical protein
MAYREVDVCPQSLLIEMDVSDELNAPAALPPGERASVDIP